MITAQIESYSECIEEIKPFYHDHWVELAMHKDKVPLAPRYDVYDVLDDAGSLLVATLRDDGDLVGYFIGIVEYELHYASCKSMVGDIFRIIPRARGKWNAVKLFRAVEQGAKDRGVVRVYYGSKAHKDASALFKYLKCEKCEVSYTKWIGD